MRQGMMTDGVAGILLAAAAVAGIQSATAEQIVIPIFSGGGSRSAPPLRGRITFQDGATVDFEGMNSSMAGRVIPYSDTVPGLRSGILQIRKIRLESVSKIQLEPLNAEELGKIRDAKIEYDGIRKAIVTHRDGQVRKVYLAAGTWSWEGKKENGSIDSTVRAVDFVGPLGNSAGDRPTQRGRIIFQDGSELAFAELHSNLAGDEIPYSKTLPGLKAGILEIRKIKLASVSRIDLAPLTAEEQRTIAGVGVEYGGIYKGKVAFQDGETWDVCLATGVWSWTSEKEEGAIDPTVKAIEFRPPSDAGATR